jgi:DNA-binding GntR family transcriptional regulator
MSFKAESLPEQIARYLTDKIVRKELGAGDRIVEQSLAEELKVSRGPIREALRILEKSMLLELTPRHGARVTELSPAFVNWLYDILTELYALLARKAAENRSEEDLRDMRNAVENIEAAVEDENPREYYDAIFEFSSVAMRASKNPLLTRILADLEPSTRRVQYATLSRRAHDLQENMKYFLYAGQHVEKGEVELAYRIIYDYAQNEKQFAVRILEEDAAR